MSSKLLFQAQLCSASKVPESFSPAYHLLLHSVYAKESFLAIMIQVLDRILYESTLPRTASVSSRLFSRSPGLSEI